MAVLRLGAVASDGEPSIPLSSDEGTSGRSENIQKGNKITIKLLHVLALFWTGCEYYTF